MEQLFCVGLGNEAIFLRQFRPYMLSFMFRFMFANICFEKNSKIHVMFIINITVARKNEVEEPHDMLCNRVG